MRHFSTIMNDEHWLAVQFTTATMTYGKAVLVDDVFGAYLGYIIALICRELEKEMSRDLAKELVYNLADKYVNNEEFRVATDTSYKDVCNILMGK